MSLNNKEPLVSIAIITYNQKEFLKECIESCLAQDYPNLEIVVADDGSTDGTHDLLNDYDIKHPGKFVLRLSKENQGITKNSNAAHFACSGEYVAWIGGDDLMLPGKITKQVEYMENNPGCTICYHDMDVFDSKTNNTLYIHSTKVKPIEGGVRAYIKYGVVNGACSTMIRRSSAPDTGYNELLPVASDWCYWVDALAKGGEIKYIPQILSRYRRHSNNVTAISEKISQNSLDHLNTCNYIIKNYPEYTKEALYCYSRNIRSLRSRLPYMTALGFSIRANFDLRAAFAAIVFLITFGKVRM